MRFARPTLLALSLAAGLAPLVLGQGGVPADVWMRYATPETAGYSPEALEQAHEYWASTQSAAYMVVDRGAVVVAWGDVDRRLMCHSVRKSLMSGLYGIHVDAGTIDPTKTMAELDIDDEPALTDQEKTAKIEHLLAARSGVYRLAAYEPPQNPKPPRGSHAPGTNFCYNNWDFNTLLTILEQEAQTRVFEDFEERFAKPLGMQDYRVRDGYYHYEREKSIHPAYPFRMTARDMARFGLLYAYEGKWGSDVILSEDWIELSTRAHSRNSETDGYAYLWWTRDDAEAEPHRMFSARGVGGQSIDVLPDLDVVMVNRTNTFEDGQRVGDGELLQLVRLVLAARVGEPAEEPELVPLESREPPARVSLPEDYLTTLQGAFEVPGDRTARIELAGSELVMHFMGMTFDLLPLSDSLFFVEGVERPLRFEFDDEGRPAGIVVEALLVEQAGELVATGELEAAWSILEVALGTFPECAETHVAAARLQHAMGHRERAEELLLRALELAPGHRRATVLLAELTGE